MNHKGLFIVKGIMIASVLSILVLNSVYYLSMVRKRIVSTRLESMLNANDTSMKRLRSQETKNFLVNRYGAEIAKASAFIEEYNGYRQGYWKDMHVAYLAVAINMYRRRHYVHALKILKRAEKLHPFFLNYYELAGYIFDSLGMTSKAAQCEKEEKKLLNGRVGADYVHLQRCI